MLYEFVKTQHDAIVARTREKLTNRPWPPVSTSELEYGVPLFLTQLSETLRWEATATPFPPLAIGESAARHGKDLRELGFTISQVVHDYGDVCQAVTELAAEMNAPITTEEFHTLNRCLDTAIAEAVTEHARLTALSNSARELERQGQLAHEMRNMVNTAMLAFQMLKRGTVAINGSTGAVLGRSLVALRDVIDNTLSDVRMAANYQRRERVPLTAFLGEVAAAARLHAEYGGQTFVVDPVDAGLVVAVDPQLLASAVMNLLNNAFKYTPPGGHVIMRAGLRDGRVRIEVEDQCGGIPPVLGDPFKAFVERRGRDRSGLGLGLSIARKAMRAHDGDISVENRPGAGCTFVVDLPQGGGEAAEA